MSEAGPRTAWITGASSGIGRALAVELDRLGVRLILSGRRASALDAVAAGLAGEALVLPFDATDYPAAEAAAARAIEWSEGLDLLVNNAGISQRSLTIDTDFAVFRQLIEVDYLAPLRLTQLVLPHMVERRSGQIAIIASVAGKVGAPLRSGYSGAKHACIGFFDTLRAEVETAYGIGVSVVIPGSVQTDVARNALAADGSRRDESDVNIAEGIPAGEAARRIADGLAARQHEIVVAEGMEAMALQLRATDPEKLFALTAEAGRKLADQRAANGAEWRPDPAKV